MAAGEIDTRIRVERRAAVVNDPDGRASGAWAERFSRWARAQARNAGGEVNVGLRLEGRQPYEFKVRSDAETRTIGGTDRLVVTDGPYAGFYNVRTAAPWRADPAYILITAEAGGPNG